MPQKMIADGLRVDAADVLHGIRGEILDVRPEVLEALGIRLHVLAIEERLLDDDVQHRVKERDVRPRIELQHVGRVAFQLLAARVHDDERLLLRGLLEEGCRHRVILRRVAAGDDDDVGVLGRGERRGHRAGADALEKRHHRRGVTEPGAVVHVVGPEAGPDELLHEIRFLVGALRGAEPREPLRAVPVADAGEARGRGIQRLLPARLAEVGEWIRRIHLDVGALRRVVAADEGRGEAVGMGNVVESEAALHAEALAVRRAVSALHGDDLIVMGLIGDLAADTAVGAEALHLLQGDVDTDTLLVHESRFHQRARRTGLHALAAGDAGAGAHGIVEIEDDLRAVAAIGHADHVVDLHLPARAHAEIAVDAGVEVDAHGSMARVRRRLPRPPRQAALGDRHALRPLPQV
jgi:hypothetical protein